MKCKKYRVETPITDNVRVSAQIWKGIRRYKLFLCRKIEIKRIVIFWGILFLESKIL